MRISDWSSDVCSSDLAPLAGLSMPAAVVSRAIDAHGVTLTLADGTKLAAPLLIVAEGRRSPTRDATGFSIANWRSEEHTSELQSLMRISYAVSCLQKQTNKETDIHQRTTTSILYQHHISSQS